MQTTRMRNYKLSRFSRITRARSKKINSSKISNWRMAVTLSPISLKST